MLKIIIFYLFLSIFYIFYIICYFILSVIFFIVMSKYYSQNFGIHAFIVLCAVCW